MLRKITQFLCILAVCFSGNLSAQYCSPNIDFETGTTAVWQFFTGTCCPIVTPTMTGAIPGTHTLTSGTSVDPYGGFPTVAPGGGSYSLKLGNNGGTALSEKARYYVRVPSTGSYSLIYRYAIVMEDPGHPLTQQPRFEQNAFDSSTGLNIPCTQFTYMSPSTLAGFSLSTLSSNTWYKPWSSANIKFAGYAGQTVVIDFATGDCHFSGHFAYAYLDFSCGMFANELYPCTPGPISLTGPSGDSLYHWFDSATFSTSYGTTATVTVSTPSLPTTYALIVTPYTGYGCTDTLYTRVIPSVTVLASNDTTICAGQSATLASIGLSLTPPVTYSWAPAAGLSCTTCSSPVATPTVTTPYVVTVTDSAGCINVDTVTVTVVPVTTCALGVYPEAIRPAFSVFPNPNNGSFTVLLNALHDDQATVTVMNMVGEKVEEFNITANRNNPLKLSQPTGVYILSVVAKDGRRYMEKVTLIR